MGLLILNFEMFSAHKSLKELKLGTFNIQQIDSAHQCPCEVSTLSSPAGDPIVCARCCDPRAPEYCIMSGVTMSRAGNQTLSVNTLTGKLSMANIYNQYPAHYNKTANTGERGKTGTQRLSALGYTQCFSEK